MTTDLHYWFADNSESYGTWLSIVPDIVYFGGIILSESNAERISNIINQTKIDLIGNDAHPIKWNMKDLKQYYFSNGLKSQYEVLLNKSKIWRERILAGTQSVDYKIVVACVKFHSPDKDKILVNKQRVAGYAFSNALMRVGLIAQQLHLEKVHSILDWPDKNDTEPYISEYSSAFHEGHCSGNPTVKYHCGPLKALKFQECIYFTKTNNCSQLQFSDIILGSTMDVMDFCLDKKSDSFGVDMFRYLIPKYYGYPGRIVSHGLSIAPSNSELRSRTLRKIHSLRVKYGYN